MTETPTALAGTVDRITFYNAENGFSVVKLHVRGRREPVAVVGTLPAVQPGEALELTGQWRTDPVRGAQFRPERAVVRPPSEVDGIIRYLGSGLIRQLGPVLAKRIVETFGTETLAVLDARPGRVREVPGIGPQRARALAAAWSEHRALRAVTAFLGEHGLDTRFAARLVGAYGADAPRVLGANPYRLVSEVPGLGFAAADRLGQQLGVRASAPARLQAAVQGALLRAAEQGHTRLSQQTLQETAAELTAVEGGLIESAIAQLIAGGVIAGTGGDGPPASTTAAVEAVAGIGGIPSKCEAAPSLGESGSAPLSGRLRIYEFARPVAAPQVGAAALGLGLHGLVRSEESLARRLLALAGQASGQRPSAVDAWLASDEEARNLAEEQRQAVRLAALNRCFVLTGGPGVGKTTTLRVLVRCLRASGRSVALAAPTGKAAKRLGEVVGAEAKTLHRLLGAGPRGFRHGAKDPLPFDAIIVDEASMLDTSLARAVLASIGPGSQLVLVGDADQLPSVGPGQVLRDLLASDRVPSVRLKTVFRQAAQSQIVRNAHLIRRGEMPELPGPAELGRGVDCVFVRAQPVRSAEVAAEWAVERLPRLLGLPPQEIQVLAPLTRVCQSLNSVLQARLNPPREQPERPHGALALRQGDRVIQTHNNYALGVFNGDTGLITRIEPEALSVDFGDGRLVTYSAADVLDLEHAYCLTVHRAQGSEWPGVVILASSSHGPMLSRNLLYTALTRARQAAVIIGDEAAIVRAVAQTRDQQRHTGLAALLQGDAAAGSGWVH